MSDIETLIAFLMAVLPQEGWKCAFELPAKRHVFTDSFEELAQLVLQVDARGSNVYFGCAAYRTKGRRKGNNALGARCLWLDVDPGNGKPYGDQQDAGEAVLAFCKKLDLPLPIFVGSGGGIHVYWPLDRTLSSDDWRAAAQLLKAACRAHGLIADEKRTTDIASVLRPPGTHNRKDPNAPRLVQVGPLRGPYDADRIIARLRDAARGMDEPTTLGGEAAQSDPQRAHSPALEARLRAALKHVPALDRKTWLDVGMALHSTGWGDLARRLWDEWSRTCPDIFKGADQQKTWESLDREYAGQRITIGTILHLAKENGWSNDVAPGVTADEGKKPDWRDKVVSAAALMQMTFEPMRFVLQSLLVIGVTLLVGRPKIGKSWLALAIALACAGCGTALGLQAELGDVLYLALEDSRRRLRDRLDRLLSSVQADPERLKFVSIGDWRRQDMGGSADLAAWCQSVAKPTLIVIDTLARFRKPATGKTPLYDSDYEAIAALQKVAIEHGVAIVVLHHDRKAEAESPFDTVSGTLGLTGGADATLIMKRKSNSVVLHAQGRDIEESETAIQFDKATCRWTVLGPAAEVLLSQERARVIDALKLARQGSLSITEIKDRAGIKSRTAADTILSRMVGAGEICRVEKGRYALRRSSDAGKIGQK
jgi:hypothetical protein